MKNRLLNFILFSFLLHCALFFLLYRTKHILPDSHSEHFFLANFENSNLKQSSIQSSMQNGHQEKKPSTAPLKNSTNENLNTAIQSTAQSASHTDSQTENFKNSYTSRLQNFIQSQKNYPQSAKIKLHAGTVSIRFKVKKTGDFTEIQIHIPSKYKELDQAALQLIKNLRKFEPLPSQLGEELEVVCPIEYKLIP